MIKVTMPVIPQDKKAEEEIRKALLNIELQLNRELDEIKARLEALEP